MATTLLKPRQTHSVPGLSPPASAGREQATRGPQDRVCPTSARLCSQCWLFSVCSAGPTAHCVSPDLCAREPTFVTFMHRAPCPWASVVLEWEWTAQGVGCGKHRHRSALPPTLRPQGWGAAPPGADRRSGPMGPQKPWSRGLLTCLPFPLKFQVECFTLNRPPLHNHFLTTSSLCLFRGPLFPWFFSLPTWSSVLILQHQPCFCPKGLTLLFLLPRLTSICRDLSPDFLNKMTRELLHFHS